MSTRLSEYARSMNRTYEAVQAKLDGDCGDVEMVGDAEFPDWDAS